MFLGDKNQKSTLKQSVLLKEFTDQEFDDFLKYAKINLFYENDKIISEGSTDNSLYFILSGRVRIYRTDYNKQEIELGVLKEEDFFGELTLLDNLPRSASVRALKDTTVVYIERKPFFEFSNKYPDIFSKILREIILRIRTSNETFSRQIMKRNEELEIAYSKLKTLDEQKTKFIALTSHEIKTPLTIMLSSLQLLESGMFGSIETSVRKTIQMSLDSGKKLKEIFDKILDVTINNHVDSFLTIQSFSLSDLVKEIHDDISILLSKRSLSISTQIPTSLNLKADRNKIKQVILNILLNAIRFTPDEGNICILGKKEGSIIQTCIKDSGVGIPKDRQHLIFSPFYKIDPVDNHSSGDVEFGSGGIGLGLTIASNFIELHGGKISVNSEINQGSEFTIHIPQKK